MRLGVRMADEDSELYSGSDDRAGDRLSRLWSAAKSCRARSDVQPLGQLPKPFDELLPSPVFEAGLLLPSTSMLPRQIKFMRTR